jgi:Mg2+/Co2+ transporter CorC
MLMAGAELESRVVARAAMLWAICDGKLAAIARPETERSGPRAMISTGLSAGLVPEPRDACRELALPHGQEPEPGQFNLQSTALPLVWLLKTSTEAVVRIIGLQKARTATVTEEEVRSLIADGTRAGIFVPQEREMIEGVMRLADRSVDVIMTPRSDIVWLGLEDSIDKIAATIAETRHSRVLICRDTIDEPVGVVHARELLAPALRRQSIDLEALMVPVLVVPDGTPVLRVLDLFKRRRLHMAVVVDEFGLNHGIVTPVDVLESIAGELPEAGEELEFTIVRRPDGSWLVDGRVPVDEFRPLFAAQLEETSALVETDKRRFGQGMLACLALDLLARRTAAHRKMANGEGQQAELVVVGAVAVWRAGTAIPGATEIVDPKTGSWSGCVMLEGALCQGDGGRQAPSSGSPCG